MKIKPMRIPMIPQYMYVSMSVYWLEFSVRWLNIIIPAPAKLTRQRYFQIIQSTKHNHVDIAVMYEFILFYYAF